MFVFACKCFLLESVTYVLLPNLSWAFLSYFVIFIYFENLLLKCLFKRNYLCSILEKS